MVRIRRTLAPLRGRCRDERTPERLAKLYMMLHYKMKATHTLPQHLWVMSRKRYELRRLGHWFGGDEAEIKIIRNSLSDHLVGMVDKILEDNKCLYLKDFRLKFLKMWRAKEIEIKMKRALSLKINGSTPQAVRKFTPRDRLSVGMVNMVTRMYMEDKKDKKKEI